MGNCGNRLFFQEDEMEDDEIMRADGSSVSSVNVYGPNTYRHKKHVAASDDQLWPDGIIPFEMDHSLDYNRERIEKAMRTIEKHSRIRFIKRTNENPFLNISKQDGCWFYNGDGKRPRISLGIGCNSYGTILHELMHAIGFPHEQRRPDRDEYITINWQNIKKGQVSQFKRLNPFEYKWSEFPFDYKSIMMYHSYEFSKNGYRTIETKDGREIPGNVCLSDLDKQKLGLL
ncbi:zinc metalloproteinase nas-7 [Nephila pilipes]|uniref:Metalloendopeptidase n=1 Tax=Nephila pilipes TaxID=299642 RepID=A0A8X6N322_NEPPI|nr:zinc metalloproteinase nas-7 [Nephila pilipes]